MAKKGGGGILDLIFGTGGHNTNKRKSNWDKHSTGHASRRPNTNPRPGSRADVKQRHNRNK